MKTMKYFFMVALALTFAACSSNDDELTQQPAEQPASNMITITAKLAPKSSSAQTRTLSDQTTYIKAEWAQNEKLEIISGSYTATANIDAVDGSGTATISFTIDVAAVNQNCTIVYPASAATATGVKSNFALLTAQDGTLSDDLDVRVGEGKILSTGTLDVTTQPAAQFAIWKLTLGSAAKNLCILADNEVIAGATLASAGTVFTVAVPAVSSKTVTVVANDESNNCYYYTKAGVSLTAGNYYQSTPSMTTLGTDRSESVYKITGTSGANIPDGRTVVFSGVNISSGITCNGDATIILMGSNTITGSYANAAIQAGGTSNTLTITGTGSLTANGGDYAAGIGGGQNTDCGRINISGGNITATSSMMGAGIGSGQGRSCAGITISGGTVVATCSQGGTGIGSGNEGSCGDITISGGTVTANGGAGAAGIGSGLAMAYTASCTNITISGGTVTANGGDNAAGIGSGCGASCTDITISGGTVNATGGDNAAGIGSGDAIPSMMPFEDPKTASCGAITITTGATSVTATAGALAPNSIGAGSNGSTSGTVTVCGVVGAITTSPFTYTA